MLKNETFKKVLKSTIFSAFSVLNRIIPKDDRLVMLYSPNHGIEHNLRPLKEYLIKYNYHNRYKIICCVSSPEYFENDKLHYVKQLRGIFYFFYTRHVFYTTGQIPIKPSKQQIVIHMDHGTTSIKTEGYLKKRYSGDVNYFSLYCIPSEAYRDVTKQAFRCLDSNLVINSEPVMDVLYNQSEKYNLGTFAKIGLWAPTFRKSDYLGYEDSEEEELLPTLKPEDYHGLNNLLRQFDIKLFVKIHDAQDLSSYKKVEYSNLEILSGADFESKGFKLYELLKQTDFLIGDYSSVCLQYLPLNKPIGYAIPDIDDYREKRGFWFEPIEDYMPGPKIKTKEQLFQFLTDITSGKDEYESERKRVNDLVNHYQDGKSCERLIQFSQMK